MDMDKEEIQQRINTLDTIIPIYIELIYYYAYEFYTMRNYIEFLHNLVREREYLEEYSLNLKGYLEIKHTL